MKKAMKMIFLIIDPFMEERVERKGHFNRYW